MRRPKGWLGGGFVALLMGCGGESAAVENGTELEEATSGSAIEAEAGYLFRLDSDRSDPGEFVVAGDGDVLRVTTGPAGIAYRPDDVVRSNDFRAEATFVQHDAPVGYREAYGIFVGGVDLETPEQEYTYLLVRGTGDFLVKRRRGDATETLVDWTPSDAVVPATDGGNEPVNHLVIATIGGETVFIINGVAVHGLPAPEVRPYGVAGVRVNHRLDITVRDWSVGPRPARAEARAPGT